MPITSISRGVEDAVDYPADTVVFQMGQPADLMYLVVEGQVEIRYNERLLETVGPGDILGELALIDETARSATATTLTACKLAGINRQRFLVLVEKNPRFALEIMQIMADRLRRETQSRSG